MQIGLQLPSANYIEVEARLEGARPTEPKGKAVVLESPIEHLALSHRALNVLHGLGCDRVQDVMELPSVRGMGPKTRAEVRAALQRSGFPPPGANADRRRGVRRGLNLLRAKYIGEQHVPRPDSIDEQRWAVFTAYFRDGQSITGIGASSGLSPSRVSRMLYEVDARLEGARRIEPEGKPIVPESPIHVLALSHRALNVLHSLGCDKVQDVLGQDLSSARGMGPKTRAEVCAALRGAGLPHPEVDAPLDSEIRSLDRSLVRMHDRISTTLETVAREIALLQKRLQKRMEARDSGPAGRVTPAWSARIAARSQDSQRRYE